MKLKEDVEFQEPNGLFFYKTINSTNGDLDLGGIAWYKSNIQRKSGIKISFKPSLILDNNYYGLQKFPQGFAFILTSNTVDNVIGEKRGGLGFEGINNAIAVFFDFVNNADKLDKNYAHFSITSNLSGPIKSVCEDEKYCNLKIPNFFDSQQEDYKPNMQIIIEFYGGKIKVFFDESIPQIDLFLPEYSDLMDNDLVNFGVSSTMSLYKGVKIEDLKLMTIIYSETPIFDMKKSDSYIAGSILTLYIYKKTSCGTNLDIFSNEESNLKLTVNDINVEDSYESFFNIEPDTYGLEINLRNVNKQGNTRITTFWNNKPIQTKFLNIIPAKSIKFDICNPSYDPVTNILSKVGTTNDKYYTFEICVTDLYKNPKSYEYRSIEEIIKVEYPNNLIPETEIKIIPLREKSAYSISIPTNSKGIYKIYNSFFFNDDVKSFRVTVGKPDPKISYGEIRDYLENNKAQKDKIIYLNLYLHDSTGGIISNADILNLNCSLSNSVLIHNFENIKKEIPLGEFNLLNEIPNLYYTPTIPGEYVFRPRLKCLKDPYPTDITCNLCTFAISTTNVDNSKFLFFSDYYSQDILSNNINENNVLTLSMDEEKNTKLTSLKIVDTTGVYIPYNKLEKKITDALNTLKIKMTSSTGTEIPIIFKINPSEGVDIFSNSPKDRTNFFSALDSYKLEISTTDTNFLINKLIIPINFSYYDDYLNNISNLDITESQDNFFSIYNQNSFELRAASSQSLFRVFAKNTQNEISFGKTLDCSKIILEAKYITENSKEIIDSGLKCNKNDFFLNISGSFLKSGDYDILLTYDKKVLFTISKLHITPRMEINELKFDNKNTLIYSTQEPNIITLRNFLVGELFSFTYTKIDEYGNVINENYIQTVNQVKIQNNGKGDVRQLYDGRILVTGDENLIGDYSVVLTLPNSKVYTLKWKRISEVLDTVYSGVDIFIEKNSENSNDFNLGSRFYPHDKFNTNFKLEILERKEIKETILKNLQIYAISPDKSIVNFKFDKISNEDELFYFKFISVNKITIAGEYKVYTFYDDIPIICQICFVKLYPFITPIDKTTGNYITDLYYLGYKGQERFHSEKNYLYFYNRKSLIIFPIFKDIYNNEISDITQRLDLGLYNEKDNNEILRFCQTNFQYTKRQYLEVCKEYIPKLDNLVEGNYFIATNLSSKKYLLTYRNEMDYASKIPSVNYSFTKNIDDLVFGSISNLPRIIVDFRNENNQRFENLDITKISLNSTHLDKVLEYNSDDMKIYNGPNKGLIMIILSITKVIPVEANAKITINYESTPIIKDLKLVVGAGRLAKIKLFKNETQFTTKNRYNVFQLLDSYDNPVKNIDMDNQIFLFNFMAVKDKLISAFYLLDLEYNCLAGRVSLKLKLDNLNELEISSPFFTDPITIPAVSVNLDFSNSFVYLEKIDDGNINEEINLKIQLLDSEFHHFPTSQDVIDNISGKYSLVVLRKFEEEIEYIETIYYNKNLSNINNGIVLTTIPKRPGDYFYLPFFNNIPIKCSNCRKTIKSLNYELKNTSIKIKLSENYREKQKENNFFISKKIFPVFKIYLKDITYTNLKTPIDDISVTFVNEKEDISLPMNLYTRNSDGIIAYLTPEGKNKFSKLNHKDKMKLKIFKKNDPLNFVSFENFFILNAKNILPENPECQSDSIPEWINPEQFYISHPTEEISIEFFLQGCKLDENTLTEKIEDFYINICSEDLKNCGSIFTKKDWYYKIIPSDRNGIYILMIGSTTAALGQKISMKYKFSQYTNNLSVSIINDNVISNILFDEKNYEIKNNYVFLKLKAYDAYNNIITRDSTNVYLRDIFFDIVDKKDRKIIYDLTYKPSTDEYLLKFFMKKKSYIKLNIPNIKKQILINVEKDPVKLNKSVFTLENIDYKENTMLFKVDYKDQNLKPVIIDKDTTIPNLSFKYETIDLTADEKLYIYSNNITYLPENKIQVKFNSQLKKYQYIGIYPEGYNFLDMPCTNCFIINNSNDYVYISSYKNQKNDCYILPLSSTHVMRNLKDKFFVFYEGTEKNFKLMLTDGSKEVKISTFSKLINNGIYQTFAGMNFNKIYENEFTEKNYKFLIINENSQKELKIKNNNDDQISNLEVDIDNVIIFGYKGRKFFAGEIQYFFIELRDKNQTLTSYESTISIGEIKTNLVKTAYVGLYLVEYTVEKIPKIKNFKIKINNFESNFIININAIPDFPIKMDSNSLFSKEILNEKSVVYTLEVYDQYRNFVCDRRLNIEIENSNNMDEYYLNLDENLNICLIQFNFSGKAKLWSPLLKNISLNLENFNESNLSNFNSFAKLISNNFKKDEIISINTVIKDENGITSVNENQQLNIKFMFYYVNEYNGRILVKDFNTGSLSSEIDNKNLSEYGNYLVKIIVDGVEFNKYAYFKIYRSEVQEVKGIQLFSLSDSNIIPLNYIYDSMNSLNEEINPGYFPFIIRMNLINADGFKVPIPKNFSAKIEFYPDIKLELGTDKILEFDGVVSSHTSYLISNQKILSNLLLHLPKGKYYMKIIITFSETNKMIKYIPMEIKVHLNLNFAFNYHLPNTVLKSPFKFVGTGEDNSIYSNLGNYSTTNICLMFDNKIYNQFLDANLFKIENLDLTNCKIYLGILYRGCVNISLMCETLNKGEDYYKIKISYKDIVSTNDYRINLDPVMPPVGFNVSTPFPTSTVQGAPIQASFKILDKGNNPFKYVGSENIEIFDNNKKLENNLWKFYIDRNNNIGQIQLLNLGYPPKIHNIKLLFKYDKSLYLNVKELNSVINITQGEINPMKTILGTPIYYKSGDSFEIPILFRDNRGNCYDDNVNTNLLKLKIISNENENLFFENFQFNLMNYNTTTCSNYVLAKAVDFSLTKVGGYKINFFYNNNPFNLINNKLFISSNSISPKSSTITVRNKEVIDTVEVKPGEEIEILIMGTDMNNNPVIYQEIIEKLKVKVGDLDLEKKDYKYLLSSDEKYIIIKLSVIKPGVYVLNIIIDDVIFNKFKGLNKINVIKGNCDKNFPNIELRKTTIFVGEYAELKITCRDSYNNTVNSIDLKDINLNIQGFNLTDISSDNIPYNSVAIQDTYISKFLILYTGAYEITAYLKGAQYGLTQKINAIREKCPDDNPIMCSDRKCVKKSNECKDLRSESCNELDKPFYCYISDKKGCVAKLEDCKCKNDHFKCMGMCLPNNLTNFCEEKNSKKSNCKFLLPEFKNVTSCNDGTCRTGSDCGNDLVCPLGFKICGPNCISKDLSCEFNPEKCKENKVTCWDFSCANSYNECPTRKTCNNSTYKVCPDGRCVSDAEKCSQPTICISPFEYLCPNFSCVKSKMDCPKRNTCPLGQSLCENDICSYDCKKEEKFCKDDEYLCNSNQCVKYQQLCPTVISCSPDKIKYYNGACTNTEKEFYYMVPDGKITCPDKTPILCQDLSCVDELSKCNNGIYNNLLCPNNAPYRCHNNECRKDYNECPTPITCPVNFPVYCSDGSCQKAPYHCKVLISQCEKIRCFDGTCVSSMSLCPTQKTCNNNMIKCWDGSCEMNLENCRPPKNDASCPIDFSFRCRDGSCRKDKKDCPTISTCPINKPIKCIDNSCRESLNLCPVIMECPNNFVNCPDGTCGEKGTCSTQITCSNLTPFLCPNKRCERDYRDCQQTVECKDFVCPDGECVSNRLDCTFITPCDAKNPVRCDSGSCATTIQECDSLKNECPVGYIKCKSGVCKANEDLCSPIQCPSNKPVKCKNGECVYDISFCDTDEGCPYIYPIKCKNGSCKIKEEDCDKKILENICPDGSITLTNECPLKNGCPKEKEIRCSDGTCAKDSTECYPARCSFTKPIMCSNGMCVRYSSDCSLVNNINDYLDCDEIGLKNHFMCADGVCVKSPEFCRPIYECSSEYSKCADGTCRLSELCPNLLKNTACPAVRPNQCYDGRCVKKSEECDTLKNCIGNKVRCPNGLCVSDINLCTAIIDHSITCEKGLMKCPDGRCLEKLEECYSINIACDKEKPVLCPNGVCLKSYSDCSNTEIGCSADQVICPDGLCIPKDSYWTGCRNKIGCPLVKPIKCYDNLCVRTESECKSITKCTFFKPYQCPDLRCVEDEKFCNTYNECPEKYPVKCNNGLCTLEAKICNEISDLCPLLAPIRCLSGHCVANFVECENGNYIEECQNNKFFCKIRGECVNTKVECIGLESVKGGKSLTTRILQNKSNKIPENHCSEQTPFSCFDGSCREKRQDCPIPKACLGSETKCPDGSCTNDSINCLNKTVECLIGYILCNDGLCRKECPYYNGCDLDKPYQCTNGRCVKNEMECLGFSMCKEKKFRCINGECKNNPRECGEIKRLFSPEKISITISKYDSFNNDLVYDNNRKSLVNLKIPANSFNITNGKIYSKIQINEVSHSELRNISYIYDTTFDEFPFLISHSIKDSDGDLTFDNSVLSPILNITCPDCDEYFLNAGLLRIEHDQYESNNLLSYDYYCLAKLIDNKWNCFDTLPFNSSNINDVEFKKCEENDDKKSFCNSRKKNEMQNEFAIDSFGVFALVIIPVNKKIEEKILENVILDNLRLVLIIGAVTFVVLFILYFIFVRILRYRTKYLDNKKRIKNIVNEVKYMMNLSLAFPGATIGDAINGINFEANPSFKFKETIKSPVLELESEIEKLNYKCKSTEENNDAVVKEIEKIKEEYQELRRIVEKMKKS